jgi:hypothetical protein
MTGGTNRLEKRRVSQDSSSEAVTKPAATERPQKGMNDGQIDKITGKNEVLTDGVGGEQSLGEGMSSFGNMHGEFLKS